MEVLPNSNNRGRFQSSAIRHAQDFGFKDSQGQGLLNSLGIIEVVIIQIR